MSLICPLLVSVGTDPGLATAVTAAAEEPNTGYIVAAFALIGVSILFFILELFVPSGGIFAVLCGAATIASVVAMFLFSPVMGLLLLVAYVIVGPIALWWGIRVWEQSPVGRKLILDAELDTAIPNEAASRGEPSEETTSTPLASFVGRTGIADSSLRPVGFVKIDGHRMDAIAEGDLIESGEAIEVVEAYDNQLKVRSVPSTPT